MRVKRLERAASACCRWRRSCSPPPCCCPGPPRVDRIIQVAAPPERVYALVVDPREWKPWSAWNRDRMAIVYSGAQSGGRRGAGMEQRQR
jgi:hypothetical protein